MALNLALISELNGKEINQKSIIEYTNGNVFRPFMGNSIDNVIYVKNAEKGKKDITFPFFGALASGDYKTGTETLEGSESLLSAYADTVTPRLVRSAMKIDNAVIEEYQTDVKGLYNYLRPQLVTQHGEILREEIIEAYGSGYINKRVETSAGTTAASLVAGAASPNRTRVLFGASDSNYNATLATAIGNVAASDTMSVDIINALRDKAVNISSASNGTSTRKITPYRVETKNGTVMSKYMMFLNPHAARQLKNDTKYKDLIDTDKKNDLALHMFNGSMFMGEIDGVFIYRIDELDNLTVAGVGAGSPAIDVAVSLLCGASSIFQGVSNYGEFKATEKDYGSTVGVAYQVYRATKRAVFNNIDHGVVYSFTAAV